MDVKCARCGYKLSSAYAAIAKRCSVCSARPFIVVPAR